MKRQPRFRYFKSPRNKQWYWHYVAGNGEVMAQGEGYTRKASCKKAITRFREDVMMAEVSQVEEP